MYIKEVRYVVRGLDTAIDSLSRAEYSIRKSEVINKTDKEIGSKIYDLSNNIRELRKEIQSIYADINK